MDKLLTQANVRLPERVVLELEAYQREREMQTMVPLSRALVIREILSAWASEREAARVAAVTPLSADAQG